MRQTTRPASSPSIQTYPYALDILLTLCFRSSGTTSSGITVGAVIPTAHALRQVGIPSGHPETSPTPTFRLADYTADRDSHPALKICRRKFITFFEQLPHQPVAISHNLQYLCNPQPEGLPPSTSTCRSSRRDVSASSESNSPDATSPDGGIGRRAGLKHQWSNPCRFDPGSGYKQKTQHCAESFLLVPAS